MTVNVQMSQKSVNTGAVKDKTASFLVFGVQTHRRHIKHLLLLNGRMRYLRVLICRTHYGINFHNIAVLYDQPVRTF
jgi:hypothetical protein